MIQVKMEETEEKNKELFKWFKNLNAAFYFTKKIKIKEQNITTNKITNNISHLVKLLYIWVS